jgi:protein tyrosine/serine phosphatase
MRVARRLSPISGSLAAVLIALAMLTVAHAAQRDSSRKTHIKNFGCVNESYYRGAQPKEEDYRELSLMGVKTVIDLQREGEADEQRMVEAAGMKFYRIPMSDKAWPAPEQTAEFLKIINDPANQPIFVHCKGGRHRTGAMTAIYRMTHDDWTADQAFQEMKQYDFDYGYGHGALKDYVYAYFSRMSRKDATVTSTK